MMFSAIGRRWICIVLAPTVTLKDFLLAKGNFGYTNPPSLFVINVYKVYQTAHANAYVMRGSIVGVRPLEISYRKIIKL